ncbi:MAG: type II secretion system GspH family protein [Victivallaceae bacterium]|nr:type II secretion system GspH family protein [Victivallaceae bacterium]
MTKRTKRILPEYRTSDVLKFTMIETVIALGVLLLAMSAVFGTIAASQQRVIRAEKRWAKQHMLTQAAEYFLLAPPRTTIPQTIFPFSDYQAFCEYSEPKELPETVDAISGSWKLVAMKIILNSNADGKTVNSITLDRIVKTND